MAIRHNFKNHNTTTALFISKKGFRLAIRTMEDNLKKLLKKLDLNTLFNITCHTFRHSFASHLNDQEVDVLIIQSLLGHSTPRSTEIYIHPAEARVREALEKCPGVLYMNKLINSGALNFNFQEQYRIQRE